MRILYFSRDYTPHDHRFLTSLAESGQEVYFLRLERGSRQLEDRSLPSTVNQVRWHGGRAPFKWQDLPALLNSLREVLRDIRPDILHAGPIQTAAFLAALSGFRPLISMSWGSDLLKDAEKNHWYRWITRYTLSRSTILVGDCAAVRQKAVQFGFPADDIFTFPWGIDLKRFAPRPGSLANLEYRTRLGWQDNLVTLSLRSWEPVYGIDVLLNGFALAARDNPDLRLMLLGGGSLAGMVHQVIQHNHLGEKVHLAGRVNQTELPQFYSAADLYVSASRSDGSSVSLMEALGSGLPVLVSDIPGNQEWVENGQQGWLFKDGDAQSLASGWLAAARARSEFPRLSRAARSRAEERADWQKNFQVLLDAYATAARRVSKVSNGV